MTEQPDPLSVPRAQIQARLKELALYMSHDPDNPDVSLLTFAMSGVETLVGELLHELAEKDAQVRALHQAQAWQPIATAPQDGTELLLLEDRRIVNGNWNRGGSMHCPHWMGGLFRPTHWMPLPLAPASD